MDHNRYTNLLKKNLQILDGGLRAIISHYTKEAGVRELERQIGKICRKCAKKIMEGETETIRVTSKNITDFLGKKSDDEDEDELFGSDLAEDNLDNDGLE